MTLTFQLSVGVFVLFICLLFFQKVASNWDDLRYPPTGKLIDIGGYRLHLYSSGKGSPSVVFDAGLSGTSLGWSLVQNEVSKFTQVCSFDRAGYAWSDESSLERTSINMARELYSLLKHADIDPPYLLVGHSFGGCNALLFAHLYPKETFGVVLVDSVHENMLNVLPEEPQSCSKKTINHPFFIWLRAALGFERLKGPSKEIVNMFSPLPKYEKQVYLAQMYKAGYAMTVAKELASFSESLYQLDSSNIHLQDKPLFVISSGKYSCKEEDDLWYSLQKDLLLKSSRSKHIIAEESDHMINHHQPAVISQAIRNMIEENI